MGIFLTSQSFVSCERAGPRSNTGYDVELIEVRRGEPTEFCFLPGDNVYSVNVYIAFSKGDPLAGGTVELHHFSSLGHNLREFLLRDGLVQVQFGEQSLISVGKWSRPLGKRKLDILSGSSSSAQLAFHKELIKEIERYYSVSADSIFSSGGDLLGPGFIGGEAVDSAGVRDSLYFTVLFVPRINR